MINIFPDLPGLSWSRKKTPIWATKIQTSVSGKELRASYYSYPRWQFSLSYELLRDTGEAEVQALIGLFNKCNGSYGSFLYSDPDDNLVVNQVIGLGDGVTKTFLLVRSYAGFSEPIGAVNGTPAIYLGGASTNAFSASENSITFATPPANGASISWTGAHYFKCRFLHDSMEFEQFLYKLWNAKKVEFVSIK